MSSLIRILLLAAAVFGAYKIYPHIKPQIAQTIGDPKVLGESVYTPVAYTINQILPDNIKLPTIKPSSGTSSPTVASPADNSSSIINNIVDTVKQKAGDAANQQIDNLKQEAGKAFCQVLLEKIKTDCGQ